MATTQGTPGTGAGGNTGFGAKDWTQLALGIAGPAFSYFGDKQNANANREMSQQELAEQKRQFDLSQGQQKAQFGVGATQMDPLAQQRSRQKSALVGQLMQNYQPSQYTPGNLSGGLSFDPSTFSGIQSFFSPEANQSAEAAYHQTARAASPTYQAPDAASVGYTGGEGGPAFQGAPAAAASAEPNKLRQLIDQILVPGAGRVGPGKAGSAANLGMAGAGIGSQFGGPIGGLIGGGIGSLVGGIMGHQNSAKGIREDFAKQAGYGDLGALMSAIQGMGPEGAELFDIGANKIGKKALGASEFWTQAVQELLNSQGAR